MDLKDENYELIDLANWVRREHYEFFRVFEEPFFGVVVEIDCTRALERSRELKSGFFLYYLHCSLRAIHQDTALRYRIHGDEVRLHHRIQASATIGRANGTFAFSRIPFRDDLADFVSEARQEIAAIQAGTGLNLRPDAGDVVHYSSLPWLKFTALSHARPFSRPDSCPKICFGKVFERDGRSFMPLSIHAHHALADGLDIGRHVDLFQQLMDQ